MDLESQCQMLTMVINLEKQQFEIIMVVRPNMVVVALIKFYMFLGESNRVSTNPVSFT